MYGYIYITTNLIDGKKYIGKHKSSKFEFNKYIGSGKILGQAVLKYGKENFKCELLESVNNVPTICFSEEELNTSEFYYTTLYDCVNSDEYYNLIDGGTGGAQVYASLTDSEKESRNQRIVLKNKEWWNSVSQSKVDTRSEKWRETYFSKSDEERRELNMHNSEMQKKYAAGLTPEEREQLNEKLKLGAQKRLSNPEVEAERKRKEKETKSHRTSEQKAEYTRKQNFAQRGRHYYTNGIETIKCKPEDVPEGFIQCKGHSNISSYICRVDNKEFLGLSNTCDYLKSLGVNRINSDRLLKLVKNPSEKLLNEFSFLRGRLTIINRREEDKVWNF